VGETASTAPVAAPSPALPRKRERGRVSVSAKVSGRIPAFATIPSGQRAYSNYSAVASFSTFCSASPCILAMSSWYFNKAPSVSPTSCGVSARASSSVSAVAQSMVSATPGDL
jgi:hypothetical protein